MKDSRKKLPARSAGGILTDNLAPVLMSTAVISAMAYIYVHSSGAAVIAYTLMSFVLACFIFTVYEVLRHVGKVWLTVIVVIAMMLISMSSSYLAEKPGELLLWFMEPSRFTQIFYGRTTSLVIMFGAVLISCLYYFTRIRYRGVFVFLICLCPFCLFAKTFTEIPVLFPIVIMTLFFFIMAGNRGKSDDVSAGSAGIGSSGRPIGRKGSILAVSSFIIVVTVIASFFPKLSFSPYREVFDEFVTGVTIRAAEAAIDFGDFSEGSSAMVSEESDKIVYYFYGDNPVLLKRQCFNYYDGNEGRWGYYGDSETGTNNWLKYIYYEDPASLFEKAGDEAPETAKGICRVVPAGDKIKALYTPENITDIRLDDEYVKIYRTENDEYFIDSSAVGSVRTYYLEWTAFTPDVEFSEKFTDRFAEELSYGDGDTDDVMSYMRAKEQAEKYNDHLLSDEVLDTCYSSAARRRDVQKLVGRIAGSRGSAYEKAAAIEQYLISDGYVYDREYVAPDSHPDYFILTSKRGACASYATAMVLMCREAGLTARYCEGFWIQKYDDKGYWYVTSSDSHAFVQVWIDGYGWTDFNPTSSATDGGYSDPTFLIVGGAALLLAVVGVIVMIARPAVAESSYVGKIKRARGSKQLRLIYNKMNRMLNSYLGSRTNTFTPVETAERIHELFGYDVGGFTEKYENAVYGGIEPGGESEAQIYLGFREAYRNRIKQDKKEKKALRK